MGPRRWPEGQLSPRDGSMSLGQSATRQLGVRLHALRSRLDPGDPCLRPPVVGVVAIWKDFRCGDKTMSSPGVTGHRRRPERQLSTRTGSLPLSQSATSQLGWGLHTLWCGIDPGDLRFRPRVVGVEEICKGF